jgi:hypothetical protein
VATRTSVDPAGHEHRQQQREHKTQLAGGQHQHLTDDGSPGWPGFLWPPPPGFRGVQAPVPQQTTLLLARGGGASRWLAP